MMSTQTSTVSLYPPGGFGAPKDRHGHADGTNVGLPEGTVVFSADNHISLADDIFYQRFPEALKEKAPRIWYEDGAYQIGRKGQSFLPGDFSAVLMQYDDLPGAASTNIEARIQELREDGVEKELAFPNAILALFHYPDKELRELAFRIYNEYIAELQERSNGHFYGAGLINWWDPQGTRRTLAELKSLGLKTFLLPLNPGKDDEGIPIDYDWHHQHNLDLLATSLQYVGQIKAAERFFRAAFAASYALSTSWAATFRSFRVSNSASCRRARAISAPISRAPPSKSRHSRPTRAVTVGTVSVLNELSPSFVPRIWAPPVPVRLTLGK